MQSQRIETLVKALELGPLVGDEDTGRTEPLIGRLRAVEAAVDAGPVAPLRNQQSTAAAVGNAGPYCRGRPARGRCTAAYSLKLARVTVASWSAGFGNRDF